MQSEPLGGRRSGTAIKAFIYSVVCPGHYLAPFESSSCAKRACRFILIEGYNSTNSEHGENCRNF